MSEIKSLEAELESVLAQVKTYNEEPTKTMSGKIRISLGEIKKKVTSLRSLLVAADKEGY